MLTLFPFCDLITGDGAADEVGAPPAVHVPPAVNGRWQAGAQALNRATHLGEMVKPSLVPHTNIGLALLD